MDKDADGKLSANDLKAVLRGTKYPFTDEQLSAILGTVVARLGSGEKQSGDGPGDKSGSEINLAEFMRGMEGDGMLELEQFKKHAVKFAKRKGYMLRAEGVETTVGKAAPSLDLQA